MDLLGQLLLLVALWGGEVHTGYAPRYSPGVMERVARNRDVPLVDCMVSSPRYPIGTWLHILGQNTNTELYCRVTDVSAERDRARHLRTRREVELGYTEALRLCGKQHINHRPEQCPVVVVKVNNENKADR